MTAIESVFIPANGVMQGLRAGQKNHLGGASNFDAMLASFDIASSSSSAKSNRVDMFGNGDSLHAFIDELFEHIQRSLQHHSGTTGPQPKFPFSSAFQSVFGTDGPLFEFIDVTTKRLGLSAEKNLALQTIAINNKDIVKTPESVQKIAAELKAAGIG